MKVLFEQGLVELIPDGKAYRVDLGESSVLASVTRAEAGRLELLVDGKPVTAYVSSQGAKYWVTVKGQTFLLIRSSSAGRRGSAQRLSGELTAPMPGQIRALRVTKGETVGKGQTLMLLEAMKMEIRVQAPRDGVVKTVNVTQGQTVEREQVLLTLEE
jgi:acetyl/propionyl-CoA carboxylase alpha subunit